MDIPRRKERVAKIEGDVSEEAQELLAHMHRLAADIIESNYRRAAERGGKEPSGESSKKPLEKVFENTFRD